MAVEIADWNDLDNVRNDLSDDYVLVNDLDEDTDGYAGVGDDFEPIGFIEDEDFTSEFGGSFDGDGFQISDLVIEYDGVEGDIALFASTDDGSLIENLSVDGSVMVTNPEGVHFSGLVGNQQGGTIQNCVSHVDVTAPDGERVGGLVGRTNGTLTESYATGSVEGDSRVGGLVGLNGSTVTDSYATGSVEGGEKVGGLVGLNNNTVTDSYATGSVEGGEEVGGLVGAETSDDSDGGIRRCYSYGTVTGSSSVGGFCGVLGQGGFADVEGYIFDSYVDIGESGQDDAIGSIEVEGESDVTELSTSEMQGSEAETNMDGFDFANVWDTVERDTETDTINGQITLDDVAVETGTVILHNFSEPESIEGSVDGYPILLSVDEDEQLESQNSVVRNIVRTETDTNGNYSADIPGATGDTIAIAVDFDDGTERYGRVVTTVLE